MGRPMPTVPPWHLWGGSQLVTAQANAFTAPGVFVTDHTLVRVQYGRPETWRFLISATLISAPAGIIGSQSNVLVYFDLYAGIGRSNVRIPFWIQLPVFDWETTPPLNQVHWTNVAQTSMRGFTIGDQLPQVTSNFSTFSDTLAAEHISIVARSQFTTNIVNAGPAVIEINGQVSPNSHVRPDWHELEPVFAGGETEGR